MLSVAKPNHPNGSVHKNQDRRTWRSVKCEGVAHCPLLSTRDITLKLSADCTKQFVWNSQNFGNTNHEFCTMITHQFKHRCLCVSFLDKNKTVIMPQPPYSPDLADFCLFPKLKIPMKGKRFATIEKIREKSKQELLAILKSVFQKCFEDWEKAYHKYIIFEGGYFEGDRIKN